MDARSRVVALLASAVVIVLVITLAPKSKPKLVRPHPTQPPLQFSEAHYNQTVSNGTRFTNPNTRRRALYGADDVFHVLDAQALCVTEVDCHRFHLVLLPGNTTHGDDVAYVDAGGTITNNTNPNRTTVVYEYLLYAPTTTVSTVVDISEWTIFSSYFCAHNGMGIFGYNVTAIPCAELCVLWSDCVAIIITERDDESICVLARECTDKDSDSESTIYIRP